MELENSFLTYKMFIAVQLYLDIFHWRLGVSLDLANSDIIWTILYAEWDGLGAILIETIFQDHPVAQSGPLPGFWVYFEVFQ